MNCMILYVYNTCILILQVLQSTQNKTATAARTAGPGPCLPQAENITRGKQQTGSQTLPFFLCWVSFNMRKKRKHTYTHTHR